ncbi:MULTISPECIES: efflux transporter outer membrane subunit [Aequorivita]|uniref:Efflux transporter outer membrane subunit n=1 Tax=Aequorivita iocasae TaxID=2803865 RepID=A0ABX7DVR1_9FLAO|nr:MULTISPECIES: efflux transporter outer membrane subunit [Aequorivita]QQX77696.1 efflux transporter outer membrane subunit [Aequorivita iocasae]UCA57195.1 efflux transporter outer membrane subunit [Aequorivita sp. F7]
MKKNSIYRILILASLPLLLVSCFAAKDYERPQVVNEANYRTENLPQDTLSIATLSWKELFTDPLLQGYIEEGLKNNMDIRVALQQIRIAEAYVKQGKAGYFPSLNGNAKYTHQEFSAGGQFGGQFSSLDQYELSAGLSWEADIWGKIRSNERAFQASYLQSIAAHQAVKSRLIANIASVYYQLLAVDEQIRVTEETIETRSKGLETTQALKEAGNVTEVGVKQTEAQLYTAQGILIDLKNQARLLENTMSILLGSAPHEISRGNLENQDIEIPLNTGIPSQLLRNRPDVMAAEYSLMNAFELTNAARANFYPSLTLSATGGFQNIEIDKLFNANSLFATIIGGLTQPIFNKRQIRTQYEVSQAQQEQAYLDFRLAIITASKEVSDALYNYESATEKIEVNQKEFEAYNLATGYSEELLNNGFANYLEVLNAQENALNSSLNLINTKNNQLQAIVDLYEALGGGWR